jgi:hypothetical protein
MCADLQVIQGRHTVAQHRNLQDTASALWLGVVTPKDHTVQRAHVMPCTAVAAL